MKESPYYFVSVVTVIEDYQDFAESFFEDTLSVLKCNYKNYELVVVDNGSRDSTSVIIDGLLKQRENIRYIRLSRRYNYEIAISAGLDSVIGDAIVILDPLQDPPALIVDMVEKIRKTNGIVFGAVKPECLKELFAYRMGRHIFHIICRGVLRFELPKYASYFVGMSRQSLNAVIQIKGKARFLRAFSAYVGFKSQIMEYVPVFRTKKIKHKSLFQAFIYAIDVIINTTTAPLRLASCLWGLAAFLNIFYMTGILVNAAAKGNMAISRLASSLQSPAMFFIIFAGLTVICEYLNSIVSEVKQRPVYFIDEEKNSSVMYRLESRKNIVKD